MTRQGRRTGSDVTAVLKSSETVASRTARMMPEGSSPTESNIAAVAYQLWVDNGRPAGSDREDWYRAEAMLKDALVVAKGEGLSRGASISRDTRTESQLLVALPWGTYGHWEVWESECGGARWIWDEATPGVGSSNRTG